MQTVHVGYFILFNLDFQPLIFNWMVNPSNSMSNILIALSVFASAWNVLFIYFLLLVVDAF